jgi:hypothetical protein
MSAPGHSLPAHPAPGSPDVCCAPDIDQIEAFWIDRLVQTPPVGDHGQ